MKSLQSHEGYLMIDDRASGGQLVEAATLTCCHCQKTQYKNPARVRPRGYCAKCDDYVCDDAKCHASCTPFMKTLSDELERIVRTQHG